MSFFSVCENNHNPFASPDADKTPFAIIFPVIRSSKSIACKNFCCVYEIEFVLPNVFFRFTSSHSYFTETIVATQCSYLKGAMPKQFGVFLAK